MFAEDFISQGFVDTGSSTRLWFWQAITGPVLSMENAVARLLAIESGQFTAD